MEYTAQQISSSFVVLEKLEEELFTVQHLCPLNFNNLYVWNILKKRGWIPISAKHKWKRDTFPERFWTNPNIILNIDSAANTKAYCTNQKNIRLTPRWTGGAQLRLTYMPILLQLLQILLKTLLRIKINMYYKERYEL